MRATDPSFYGIAKSQARHPQPAVPNRLSGADLSAIFSDGNLSRQIADHIVSAFEKRMLVNMRDAFNSHMQVTFDPRYQRRARFSNGGSVYDIDILGEDPRADRLDEFFPNASMFTVDVKPVSDAVAMELQLLFDCQLVDPKDV